MSYKFPGAPSAKAYSYEMADFIEVICLTQSRASMTDISRLLNRLAENDYENGVEFEDEVDPCVEAGFREIELRISYCDTSYPFTLSPEGFNITVASDVDREKLVTYCFMLLATRLNMKSDRTVASGIDASHVFEELSAKVAEAYFGEHAESLVFGTSMGSTFVEKLENLCLRLKENIRGRTDRSFDENDGRVDVVVWKEFSDERIGKLIGMGQCKTGTAYTDADLVSLRPVEFFRKYILGGPPPLAPIKMVFLAEALDVANWENVAVDSHLLFERCRIMDYFPRIDADLMNRMTEWVAGKASQHELNHLVSRLSA